MLIINTINKEILIFKIKKDMKKKKKFTFLSMKIVDISVLNIFLF